MLSRPGKLRLGLISTARINHWAIFDALRGHCPFVVSAVASRSLTTAREYAALWGVERFYGSYESLLSSPDVDAIYVSLPNSLHALWTHKGVLSGKHVLCEKPLSADPGWVRRLDVLAKDKGVTVFDGMHYRYHEDVQKTIAKVQSGAIGRLREMHLCFHGGKLEAVDIRRSKALGGGAIMDVGSYCVDFIHAITDFKLQACTVSKVEWGDDREVDVAASVDLRFESGIEELLKCTFDVSVGAAKFYCSVQILGSSGIAKLEFPFLPVMPGDDPQCLFSAVIDADSTVSSTRAHAPSSYSYQLSALSESILNQRAGIQSGTAHRNAEVLCSINEQLHQRLGALDRKQIILDD